MSHYFTNDNLKSEIKMFNTKLFNESFSFETDNGVFSKGEIDYGTYLLMKNIIPRVSGKVLDLGCGYGVIGIVLSKLTNSKVLMVDINKRAVHLAKMNIKLNHLDNIDAMVSDGFLEIKEKFDYIVSNPPIRVGKEKLYSLIKECKNYLKKDGCIYIVVRKQQGAYSLIKDMSLEFDVNIIDKDKGFLIICLKSC